MFIVDMKAPGVEVRPIKQMSGGSEFNEVFFTDVRIKDTHRLGEVGEGWKVSLTTLMNERMSIGAGMPTGFPEMLDGRVKTLHPKVHGGLLAIRENAEHARAMSEHGIEGIDLLVCNLYPFEATVRRRRRQLPFCL